MRRAERAADLVAQLNRQRKFEGPLALASGTKWPLARNQGGTFY